MTTEWNVKTSSQAVKFLNRVFRHQYQREIPALEMNQILQVIVDAQSACLDEMYKEAA